MRWLTCFFTSRRLSTAPMQNGQVIHAETVTWRSSQVVDYPSPNVCPGQSTQKRSPCVSFDLDATRVVHAETVTRSAQKRSPICAETVTPKLVLPQVRRPVWAVPYIYLYEFPFPVVGLGRSVHDRGSRASVARKIKGKKGEGRGSNACAIACNIDCMRDTVVCVHYPHDRGKVKLCTNQST